MKIIVLLIMGFLSIGLIPQAAADENIPLFYSRSNIIITRKNPPLVQPMPWQAESTASENPSIIFDMEIRDATILYKQEGWFNLSSPSERSGVLLVFAAPSIAPIERIDQYSPLDVLLVDEEGTIVQIMPSIVLSELKHEIMPKNPVLAFMFLRGGLCQKLSIMPGDDVEYKLFKKPPVVLTAPTSPAPAQGQPTIKTDKK